MGEGGGCYLGIDIGTGSVRAGLFDRGGVLRGLGVEEIQIWRPQVDFVEQSSDDIWRAVGVAVKQAMQAADLLPEQVRGIGFDATCSLVALDENDRPVSTSPTGRDAQNIIVWMDHRALEQTERINAGGHDVLRYVGGRISPEMQTPKLLWLKENLPQTWRRAARFLDLPDFLTYRATGDDARSLCTTVCKWTYLGHEQAARKDTVGRWAADYLTKVGLQDFVDEEFRRIGARVQPLGVPAGRGLTAAAAADLGLRPGTPVSIGIIDAHAGGLGVLGTPRDGRGLTAEDLDARLALIGGTSSCHMAASREPRFIPGVWGPYYSAMIPGMWLTEGGQSATGALIDHVIDSHTHGAALREEAGRSGKSVYQLLNERLEAMAAGTAFPAALTRDLHVLPYFHGNRSPRADATLRGMISGLKLSDTADDLALLYLATIQAIALGTWHIIDTLNRSGYRIDTILACGGGTKNPVFLREHADATGCHVLLPREPEAVLLGAAILGAVACCDFESILEAMGALNQAGATITPAGSAVAEYHTAKRAVFLRMHEDFQQYRAIMGQRRAGEI